MTNWKEYKLGEIADVRDGTHDSPKQVEYGKPLVTSKHIKGGRIELSSTYLISFSDFEKINKRSKVDKSDILFSMIGTIGEMVIVNDEPDFAIKNVGLFKTSDFNLSKWIYYYLKSPIAQNELLASLKGSTQQYISLTDLRNFPIKLPPVDVRDAIAEILSSLDDKIELNNQINKDLEALAQALFKQWFIDFEFPNENGEPYRSSGGEMVDSELGEIPKSWIATNYGAITKKENLKVKKSKKSITKVYSAIKTSELVLSEDYFTKQVFSKSLENYYVVENFWFAYNPSRINIGSIGLNKNEAGAVSPVYVVFSTVDNMHFYIENHLKLENIKNEITQKCSGTVRQALNYDSLSTFPVVKPPKSLIDKFNLFWAENSNLISQIKSETEYLIGLRDELLPKLIAGELEVSDIQTKTL